MAGVVRCDGSTVLGIVWEADRKWLLTGPAPKPSRLFGSWNARDFVLRLGKVLVMVTAWGGSLVGDEFCLEGGY